MAARGYDDYIWDYTILESQAVECAQDLSSNEEFILIVRVARFRAWKPY